MAPVAENNYSGLLSNEENLQVLKLLGNRCQSLCTTVIQLYLTQPPSHAQWIKKATGVLCFVKDNIKKNFFFRLFCLKRNIKLWEHEMYNNMEYMEGTSFFHMFEGEECLVAFNFASVEEARILKTVVVQKIQNRKRREEKRARQISHSQTLPPPSAIDFAGFKKNLDATAKQAKRRRNITKADIGTPRDFKHISHVGWNSTSGFDINTEDEQLKAFFKKAGVSEQQLQDKSTREYIYDFINKNGGREAVAEVANKAAENSTPPPAVPPRGPARAPHFRNAPPPPIPVKNNHITPRKPKPADVPPKKPPPAPIPGCAPPAPPPPPPPPSDIMERNDNANNAVPPPPPPPTIDLPSVTDTVNSALLQSIRNGTTLKPVEERKTPPAPQEDARGDLLSEIRKGCKLRPVDERDIKPVSNPTPAQGGYDLASALARALAERSKAIHSEDDDDNSDESTDEEWED